MDTWLFAKLILRLKRQHLLVLYAIDKGIIPEGIGLYMVYGWYEKQLGLDDMKEIFRWAFERAVSHKVETLEGGLTRVKVDGVDPEILLNNLTEEQAQYFRVSILKNDAARGVDHKLARSYQGANSLLEI